MGGRRIAVIDPGPDVEDHVRALSSAVAGAESVLVALTHGHADHAGAASEFARRSGARILGPPGVAGVDEPLEDGDRIRVDGGTLVAVHTPGHTPEHLCFHWPERAALFAGDLLLGVGDTTWVAEYPGCVADYLASLERVRALELDVIYPAHGPPLTDPADALDRYERHRRDRIRQVERALADHPDADDQALLEAVYGDTVPSSMRGAALRSLGALVEHVKGPGATDRADPGS